MNTAYAKSADKTTNVRWGNFVPSKWAKFKAKYPHIQFVDCNGDVNREDTIVFLVDTDKILALDFAEDIHDLRPDEINHTKINEHESVVRLWWD